MQWKTVIKFVGCAGVTLSAVATSMGIEIREGTVEVEGDLDFRGDATPEQLQILIKLTERFCVVYQTLTNGVKIETSLDKR